MSGKTRRTMQWLALQLPVVCLTGCSLLKAGPSDVTGFVPHPELLAEHRERAPFHGYWVADPAAHERLRLSLRKVYLRPVSTDIATARYRTPGGGEGKRDRVEEVEELARYFRERVRLAILAHGNPEFQVANEPQADALPVELALVDVEPTRPAVNLAGTAAGFVVPGGGLIKTFGGGFVAMEGMVTDPVDAAVLEAFRDREGSKKAPATIKDYRRYHHIRVALDDWADQLAELLCTPAGHRVEDSLPFSINPL